MLHRLLISAALLATVAGSPGTLQAGDGVEVQAQGTVAAVRAPVEAAPLQPRDTLARWQGRPYEERTPRHPEGSELGLLAIPRGRDGNVRSELGASGAPILPTF